MKYVFAFIFSLIASSSVFAGWRYDLQPPSNYIYASAQAACNAGFTVWEADLPANHPWRGKGPVTAGKYVNQWGCYRTDQQVGSQDQTFPVTWDGKDDEPNKCLSSVGKTHVINWTEGFTATKDEGDRKAVGGSYTPPPEDGNVCEAGCVFSAQLTGPGVEYFVSQQATSQGLYRRSRDMPSIGLGRACTTSQTDPNHPNKVDPKCDGAVGLVNNVQTCVSTPSQPVTTTPMAEPSKTPIAGNPTAGPAPLTGSGSGTGSAGRTPDAGVGGNSGGSAVAAVGGKGGSAGGTASGTGTVKAPASGQEQAACGAPGQPVCAVKMDEKDVLKEGDFTKGNEALGKAETTATDGITNAHQIQAPSWSFSFQLPTGCAPFNTGIKGFVLNPCQYQSTMHDLMSMIWAAVTAFCIIGMVGRTIREA